MRNCELPENIINACNGFEKQFWLKNIIISAFWDSLILLNKIGNSVQILTSDNNSIQGEVLLSIVYCLLSQYLISYSHCFSTRSYSLRDSTGGYGPESTHQPGLVCCLQSTPESLESDRCAGAFRKHLNRYKHKNKYKYWLQSTQLLSSACVLWRSGICVHLKNSWVDGLILLRYF